MKQRFWSYDHEDNCRKFYAELVQVKWKRLVESDRILTVEWEPAYA